MMEEKRLSREETRLLLRAETYAPIRTLEKAGKLHPIQITRKHILYDKDEVLTLLGLKDEGALNKDYAPEAWE